MSLYFYSDEEMDVIHTKLERLARDARLLTWEDNGGSSMGPNSLLRLGGECVGHFYEDASKGIDGERVRDDIAARYNAHNALVAALENAKAFHDRDEGCNGFTSEYEILRFEIDAALKLARGG